MPTIHEAAQAMQGVHEFRSTGEAYDASNCGLEIGTIIHIPRERVVGLSWAWPIAVTEEKGNLHGVNPGAIGQILADMGVSRETARRAVELARSKGYQIDADWAREFA
jgi:hypothetical protein